MVNTKSNQLTLSTICFLLTGTGSIYSLDSVQSWQPLVNPRVSLIFFNSPRKQIDVREPIEHLENVRAILNPPIAMQANLFGVSRQSIYKWLAQTASPEPDKLERIVKLSKIADAFKLAGIHRAGNLLHMKLFDGQSLLDLFKKGEPYDSQVKELIKEAQIMEAAYQRSGLAQSNAKPSNDWLSSVSIPAYREEN